MIRFISALFAFAVLLCGWIIYRPVADLLPAEAEVTRAETEVALNAPSLTPAIVADQPEAQTFADVTAGGTLPELRNAPAAPTPMGNSAADKILAALGNDDPTTPSIRTDDTTIEATTAGILAGLGVQVAAPAQVDPNDPLFAQTQAALSGIAAITGHSAAPAQPLVPADGLQTIVAQALKEGQSDAYIDALLNEAAAAGSLSVPEMLVTSDGRVDTAVLLASLVAQAQIAAGGAAPAVPEVVGGDGVEVRVVQTATETKAHRFYTVNPGDSLGAIAVKFYGNVAQFPVIFEANRQILSSPNEIQAGQRLVIPELG